MPRATTIPGVFFLPGAGGSGAFWRPVMDFLPALPARSFSWPGLGNEPHDPRIQSLDDLVAIVLSELSEPSDLVAQSMGGLVALKVALAAPGKVRRLVLTGTSGGVPVLKLGGTDWRDDYQRAYPNAATWITNAVDDLTPRLPSISSPVLLLWGEADPISPIAVAEHLVEQLPDARLITLPGAGHDLAVTHPERVARAIMGHLGEGR